MRHKMYQRFKAEFEALPEYATGGADKIRFLLDKWAELEQQLEALNRKIYDAYGLGLDDGIEMEQHPLGLGGKSYDAVLSALKEQGNG